MGAPADTDLERCVCERCPTFTKGDTKLFCVHGRSKMNIVERGCLCRTCPVHIEYRLRGRAYCLRGKPEEQ